ncbi:murein hydrolase activator EnvC family protein [Candidatus Riflebacteria bacterium]
MRKNSNPSFRLNIEAAISKAGSNTCIPISNLFLPLFFYKIVNLFFLLFLVFIPFLSETCASTSLNRELEKIELELKLSGIKYLRAQKREIKIHDKIKKVKDSLKKLDQKIHEKDLKIESLNLNINSLKASFGRTKKKIASRKKQMYEKLKYYYKGRIEPYLNSVICSKNIPTFIYRYNLLKVLIKKDRKIFKNYQKLKNYQEKEIEQLASEKKKLAKIESGRQKNILQFKNEIDKFKKILAGIKLEKELMGQRVEKLLKSSKKIKKDMLQPAAANKNYDIDYKKKVDNKISLLNGWKNKGIEQNNNSKVEITPLKHPITGLKNLDNLVKSKQPVFKKNPNITELKQKYAQKHRDKKPFFSEFFLKHGEHAKKISTSKADEILERKKRLNKDRTKLTLMKDGLFHKKEKKPTKVTFQWPIRRKADRVQEFRGSSTPMIMQKGMNFSFRNECPVHAAASGRVLYRGVMGSLGNVVILNHENGYSTLYGNLDTFNVRVGQRLERGYLLGRSANTKDGDYKFHFEVRHFGTPVEPRNFLPQT